MRPGLSKTGRARPVLSPSLSEDYILTLFFFSYLSLFLSLSLSILMSWESEWDPHVEDS